MGTETKQDSEAIWKAVYHGEACHTNTLAAVGKVVYIWQKKSSSHNTKKSNRRRDRAAAVSLLVSGPCLAMFTLHPKYVLIF